MVIWHKPHMPLTSNNPESSCSIVYPWCWNYPFFVFTFGKVPFIIIIFEIVVSHNF